jgi:hypothetical protein
MKQFALIVFLFILCFSVNGFGQAKEITSITPVIKKEPPVGEAINCRGCVIIYDGYCWDFGIAGIFIQPGTPYFDGQYWVDGEKILFGEVKYEVFAYDYCTSSIGFTRKIYDAMAEEDSERFEPGIFHNTSIPNYKPANEE